MKKCLHSPAVFCWLAPSLGLAALAAPDISPAQRQFRKALEKRYEIAKREGAAAVSGKSGWLFLTASIHFLAADKFWGQEAEKVSRSRKPQYADPIPAILDFHRQLQERGIELLLLPVPPKAVIYPEEAVPEAELHGEDSAPYLHQFYHELGADGVEVLDLTQLFADNRADENGPVFCKTDSHWSGIGCVLAAKALADALRPKLRERAPASYTTEWRRVDIRGDLRDLCANADKTGAEQISVRTVTDKSSGAAISPDPQSPLLLLGDSHLLVFHDFLAQRAGLLDQLAAELGFAPDLIATRGSAATAVRITLYRHNMSDPAYLAKKKVIVWCFAAREFTEAEQGWVPEPIAK